MGAIIYTDPEAARKDGRLEFEPNQWLVTPNLTISRERLQTSTETAAPGLQNPATNNGIPGNLATEGSTASQSEWAYYDVDKGLWVRREGAASGASNSNAGQNASRKRRASEFGPELINRSPKRTN
jgi:hypothetical protein